MITPNKGPSDSDVEVSVVHERGVDDKWLECAVEGCKFWTKKPARMRRHERCHVGSRYQCPDCGKRLQPATGAARKVQTVARWRDGSKSLCARRLRPCVRFSKVAIGRPRKSG